MHLRLLLGLFLLLPALAFAEERILSFDSRIIVQQDGSMQVVETIRVKAEGDAIRRGIYRDFPTDYRDRYGNRVRVAFDVEQVRRDGTSEPWHRERRSNGVRVYIGDADHLLSPGVYAYTLAYRTDRQLGYFEQHDELYWNVTGNDWAFPIDQASAEVIPPPGVTGRDLEPLEAYTGPTGSKGQAYTVSRSERAARFETTAALAPGEGLTIVAGWPKGHVAEPTREQRIGWLLEDNAHLLVGGGGLLLLVGYFLLVWHRFGRDPEVGVIFPRYEPPAGYSPGSTRFIRRMGYDHKAFAAAVVGLAVKGQLRIEEDGGNYTLTRTEQPAPTLGPGEHALLKALFRGGSRVELKKANHARVSAAIEAHKKALKSNFEKRYFMTNTLWMVPGVLLSVAVIAAAAWLHPQEAEAPGLFLAAWLAIWTIGTVFLVRGAITAFRAAHGVRGYLAAFGQALFALPFLAFEVAGMVFLVMTTSFALLVLVLGVAFLNLLFYHLLKAPTLAGRKLLDELEGFRLYLDVAERDELRLKHPPEKTPELFERYLPFALALDVEQRWAERFARLFARLDERREDYRPAWYHGSRFDHRRMGGFTSAVGSSLASAISSASTAPGSSSGGGGGGSSGGGGGGGGGGGW